MLFWIFQFVFWTTFVFFYPYFLQRVSYAEMDKYVVIRLIILQFSGIIYSSIQRNIYKRIKSKWNSLGYLTMSILISSIVLSNVWFFEMWASRFFLIIIGIEPPEYNFQTYYGNIIVCTVILISWSLFYLFYKLWEEWKNTYKQALLIKELKNQKLEAELNALKSQLNPHFLFNVLNTIYSNSILKSDVTPSIVLKLSDLMSYILYDCKTDTVLLQKELVFIKNYIELEKIRLEDDIEVEFHVENITNSQIPPLLFVPLIENAFKHGIGSLPKSKSISLTIKIYDNTFFFSIENSKGLISDSFKNTTKGGIGIANVKKRLELLYPNSHKIKLINNDDKFSVEILINNFK